MPGKNLLADEPTTGRNLLAPEPLPEGNLLSGAMDVAGVVGSGVVAEPVAGLAGLARTTLDGGQQGGQTVRDVRDTLTFEPRTQAGENAIGAIGETLAPIGEGIANAARFFGVNAEELARELGFGEKGQSIAGAIGETIPTAAGLVVGGGQVGRGLSKVPPGVREKIDPTISTPFTKQSPAKERIAEKIAEGSTENDLAGYMVNGRGRVKKDPLAKEAIKQGLDEGVAAAIKGSTPADRSNMLKMLDTLEKGRRDARFGAANRPADHIGDALKDRILFVRNQNKIAGTEIDRASIGLKGEAFDSRPVEAQFLSELDGMGVRLDSKNKPIFKGSDIEGKGKGVNQARAVLSNVIARMRDTAKNPDAFAAHKLKRYIDEQVTYGKNIGGLGGNVERILKNLRRNIDNQLDGQFPAYDAANTKYADTIGALDAFQDVAGKKMQLEGPNADKAIGTLSRRLMSNAQSRITLMDAVDQMNDVAKRYGLDANDDIMTQVMFIDELESMFGAQAKTSFQGDIEKGVARGITDAKGVAVEAGAKAAGGVINRIRGVNPEGAIKALRELLQRELGQLPAPRPASRSQSLAESP